MNAVKQLQEALQTIAWYSKATSFAMYKWTPHWWLGTIWNSSMWTPARHHQCCSKSHQRVAYPFFWEVNTKRVWTFLFNNNRWQKSNSWCWLQGICNKGSQICVYFVSKWKGFWGNFGFMHSSSRNQRPLLYALQSKDTLADLEALQSDIQIQLFMQECHWSL